MSFRIDDLPDPENRQPRHWVVFYMRLENAVAQGETVSINGRSVSMPDLETIRKARKDWEAQLGMADGASSGTPALAPIYLG